jgi:heat shock protein HslJ
MTRIVIAALLAVGIGLPGAAQEMREITGSATYMARIALTPDAVLMVEARGTDDTGLGLLTEPTNGAQVPLPFALEIPGDMGATLRVAISSAGQVRWLGPPVSIDAGTGDVDVGEVVLSAFTPMGFASTYRCGDRRIEVGFDGDDAIMDVGGDRFRLRPVEAASGARFEAPDDPGTWFWSRGDAALVSIAGTELPECRLSLPMGGADVSASGNEPFWRVDVSGGEMMLTRPDFDPLILSVVERRSEADGTQVIVSATSSPALRAVLALAPGPCADTMADQVYPFEATLELGDTVLTGCGGDPRDLLTASEVWTVTEIAGAGILEGTEVQIGFTDEGRFFGTAGCNRLMGVYMLTGEGLSFGGVASTMMACPDAIMAQEMAFSEALGQVISFDIGDGGELILRGPEGPVVRAVAAE